MPLLQRDIPFNFVLLSCHIHILEWMYTLQLPESQGTPCTKKGDIGSLNDSNGIQTHKY